MARVINQIIKWVSQQPYWQQACFDKIFKGQDLSRADYHALLENMLQDGGLLPMPQERPDLSFYKIAQDSSNEKIEEKIIIKELTNLKNINALAEDQRLTFHPQLTVIFGANGSGKSGYARVLGNASFTRGDKDVLPNINHRNPENFAQTANIVVEVSGIEKKLLHKIGTRNFYLDSFYMFDTTSVVAHLSSENQMSFSPAGLDLLSQLVDVTDEVRAHLDEEIAKKKHPNTFSNSLSGKTAIKVWLENIDASSDIDELDQYSTWSNEDQTKYETVDRRIAVLKSENTQEKISELEQKIRDIEQLNEDLIDLDNAIKEEKQKSVLEQVEKWNLYRSRLEFFQDQGKLDDWITFIKTARDYTNADVDYPGDEDQCIFCNQPLSADAVQYIHGLWDKLEDNTYRDFDNLSKEITIQIQHLTTLNTNLLDEERAVYRQLKSDDPATLAIINSFTKFSEDLRTTLIDKSLEHNTFDLQKLPENGQEGLHKLITEYQQKIKGLLDREVEKEIEVLTQQKLTLEHQKYIHSIKDEIRDYINNLKWISRAEDNALRGNSRSITLQHGQLFKSLVTEEYIRLFEETIRNLCCPMNLKIVTRNKKGVTYRQISLNPENEDADDLPTPNKVLSEGEQRAVALSDFFTEVALDTNSRGVILDDPITSLDFAWQDIIANYIVQEAKRQQVILFTHDLHFMHCLTKQTEGKVEFSSHWIEKRNGVPGYVFLDNSPAVESNYKSAQIPLKKWQKARGVDIPPEQVEMILKEGFGALRSCYEYLIIYKIIGNVVQRFDERISFERLKDVCVDPEIHQVIIDKISQLSRYIEGHLHSDIHNAQKPMPDMLKQEIDTYQQICKRIKESIKQKDKL